MRHILLKVSGMIVSRKHAGINMHGKTTEVLEFDNVFTHPGLSFDNLRDET